MSELVVRREVQPKIRDLVFDLLHWLIKEVTSSKHSVIAFAAMAEKYLVMSQ